MSQNRNRFRNNDQKPTDLGAQAKVIRMQIYGEIFEYRVTTANLKNMIKRCQEADKYFEDNQERFKKEDSEQAAREVIKFSIDKLLGNGAYTRISTKESDIFLLTQTFLNVTEYLTKSLDDLQRDLDKDKLQKLVEAKKQQVNGRD